MRLAGKFILYRYQMPLYWYNLPVRLPPCKPYNQLGIRHRSMTQAVIIAISFAALLPLHAATVDVTGASQVAVPYDSSLLFDVMSDYAAHAPLDSPYPGQVSMVLGGLPVGQPLAPIPGTSSVYNQGILFSGTLESLDGSIVIPLFDSNAARLGLPAGEMVLGPGYRSGGSYSGPISLLSASATLSPSEAAALFCSGEAVLRLRNLGADITFGYSETPITGAFSASLIGSDGSLSVGAVPVRAVLDPCPEPGTIALFAIGLAIIGQRSLRPFAR
jgi:hypothetical protein